MPVNTERGKEAIKVGRLNLHISIIVSLQKLGASASFDPPTHLIPSNLIFQKIAKPLMFEAV